MRRDTSRANVPWEAVAAVAAATAITAANPAICRVTAPSPGKAEVAAAVVGTATTAANLAISLVIAPSPDVVVDQTNNATSVKVMATSPATAPLRRA